MKESMPRMITEDTIEYKRFLDTKRQAGILHGFAGSYLPDFLFDFQKALLEWSLKKGLSLIHISEPTRPY